MPAFLYRLVTAAVGSTLAAATIPSIALERSSHGLVGLSRVSQEERTQLPAAQRANAPSSRTQDACDTADNMDAVRACIYQQHDQKLQAKFKKVRRAINAQSETAANKLDRAQIAWRNFMDASCDYSARAVPEGAYLEDARINCATDFMVERIRILDAYQREFRKLPQNDR
jgi:uncharacterized protein YecT (DUF1311 family)